MGGRPDHDAARFCGRLEAGGEVRRVADCREAVLLGGADVSDHRRAAVDADAESRPVRPPGRDGLGSIGERKRGSRRAQRMIGLVGGCVEDDHHGVAREALDHPVLGRDDGNDLRPVGVQHGDDLGRGRPLREGREALEVCEEDADVPLLASEHRRIRMVSQARFGAEERGRG